MKDGRLTEKQRRFIDYYIMTGGNKVKAIRLAGYSEKGASKMAKDNLEHPAIRDAILARQQAIAGGDIADIDEIKTYWTSVMRGQETETCFNRNRKAYTRDVCANLRLKAASALAKSQGAFLKENIRKEKLDSINIIWVDDYGEE